MPSRSATLRLESPGERCAAAGDRVLGLVVEDRVDEVLPCSAVVGGQLDPRAVRSDQEDVEVTIVGVREVEQDVDVENRLVVGNLYDACERRVVADRLRNVGAVELGLVVLAGGEVVVDPGVVVGDEVPGAVLGAHVEGVVRARGEPPEIDLVARDQFRQDLRRPRGR
jgi:hypothetical protein